MKIKTTPPQLEALKQARQVHVQKLESTFLQRFWDRVEVKSPLQCWPWTKAQWNGYGQVARHSKVERTHRVAWDLCLGPIPKAMSVLHKCDNQLCCNPWHLYLGTQQDNVRDRVVRGREGNRKGVLNGKAKLNEDLVKQLRKEFEMGATKASLGKKYGISAHAAGYIIRRKNWAHVQ